MYATINNRELIIHDATPEEITHNPVVDGEKKARGAVPRDYGIQPQEMFDAPSGIELIPEGEYASRITEMEASKSRLTDIRFAIPGFKSLDQGQVGYCWFHSGTHTVMYVRALNHQPYVPLSAYSGAATIKKGRDEGGWGPLCAQFLREKGVMPQSIWPQGDRNYTKYDTPANWKEAEKYKITLDWVDLTKDVYDQKLTFAQILTCLFYRAPCILDFNWWSHSVMGADPVSGTAAFNQTRGESGKLLQLPDFELVWGINNPVTGGMAIRIQNSWGDSWSDRGTGILTGSKAIADSAVATRGVMAA